ncbi:YqcC family protein [Cronobacter turicensis]|uniref:YqcC family protein n=1 Tax=Cronobacter turicensis TaxID=413502 RepID=UPI001E029C97|nr:YqcC family protein [Cronobacter turicensis]EGT5683194.1 YqcC family protein [Cronobacter turicensis]EGT5742107.1 YqcC family protein [Cronobacter turicensis]ELY6321616.1 YqcC family protein [Cronobacter turicensis]MDI6433808.1 YqcC family protein [Cronobacter turicensis]
MERHQRVRQQLQRVEQVLRHHQQWQIAAPDSSAFESTQPFCMDTLEPYEWLQWVLIPRLHALLDAGAPLPQAFAVAPYYEVALEASHPARDAVLVTLGELDALFAGDAA